MQSSFGLDNIFVNPQESKVMIEVSKPVKVGVGSTLNEVPVSYSNMAPEMIL
jgi:hypothetical protein